MPGKDQKVIAGRYEVISQIGAGGIAFVYRAKDHRLAKEVAVKMLIPEMMTDEAVMRFQHEAKTVSSLRHPNVVRVLDFGVSEDNQPYLVMDYVQGATLAEYVEESGPIPIEKAGGIFIQICDGMSHAHELGILHRDLKSSNVMLVNADTANPKAFVMDFGLAKRTEDGGMKTRTGVLIGSPLYMSPEHTRGLDLDARADIYSMGCVMFEALTGTTPIQGETVLDTIMRQTTDEPLTLEEALPDTEFSKDLEYIVAKCLRKDPDTRFQSMEELKSSLLSLTELAQTRVADSETPHEVKPDLKETTVLPGESRNRSIVIAALVFVTVIGALAAMLPTLMDLTSEKKDTPKVSADIDGFESIVPLPGTKKWEPIRWTDGYTWWKRLEITDKDLKDTSQFKGIEYLSLWKEPVTASGVSNLTVLPLKGLYMQETGKIDDAGMAEVGKIKTLEVLHLEQNYQLKDNSLRHLTGLNLKKLWLSQNRFTDEALRYIGQIKSLKSLSIDRNPKITGSGIEFLHGLSNLEFLDAGGSLKKGKGVIRFGDLKGLKILLLHECGLTDKDLLQISTLPQLETLVISKTSVTDKGIQYLKNMKTLKKVYMDDTPEATLEAWDQLEANGIEVIEGKFNTNK